MISCFQAPVRKVFVLLHIMLAAALICGVFFAAAAQVGIIVEEIDEEQDTTAQEKPSERPLKDSVSAQVVAEKPQEDSADTAAAPDSETDQIKQVVESDTADTSAVSSVAATDDAEGAEVYNFDASRGGYYSAEEKKSSRIMRLHSAPAKRRVTSADIRFAESYSKAPIRPIGKTIAGIILTADGAALTVVGMVTMIAFSTSGSSPGAGVPLLIAGFAQLIPCAAMLTAAKTEWNIYSEWENAPRRSSGFPAIKIQLAAIDF